ncbi:MAG TPA: hypothetical protein VHU15_07895 [Stellaceae bacterium]|jgi:hypothetical protein|nr:hypothetical protein [Stellaceae bacterium]
MKRSLMPGQAPLSTRYRPFCAPTWITAGFAMLVACAPIPQPPFDLTRLTPEKVLDVIEWLGSLDLSQPDPVMDGLHLTPEFKPYAANMNGVVRVYFGPMRNGSKTLFDYAIYDLHGVAAKQREGGTTRAFLRWDLRPQGDFYSAETCVRVQDFQRRFGAPVEKDLIPDGGGTSFLFRVSSRGGWRTYTAGYEAPEGCIHVVPIRQTDR